MLINVVDEFCTLLKFAIAINISGNNFPINELQIRMFFRLNITEVTTSDNPVTTTAGKQKV